VLFVIVTDSFTELRHAMSLGVSEIHHVDSLQFLDHLWASRNLPSQRESLTPRVSINCSHVISKDCFKGVQCLVDRHGLGTSQVGFVLSHRFLINKGGDGFGLRLGGSFLNGGFLYLLGLLHWLGKAGLLLDFTG